MNNLYARREIYEDRAMKPLKPVATDSVHMAIIQIQRLVTNGIV